MGVVAGVTVAVGLGGEGGVAALGAVGISEGEEGAETQEVAEGASLLVVVGRSGGGDEANG